MKRNGRKYPSNYVKANTDIQDRAYQIVHDWIDKEVEDSGDLGFIDGDFFMAAYDWQFTMGYFSKLIDFVRNYIKTNPDASDEDATVAALDQASYEEFDANNCLSVIGLPNDDIYELIDLFEEHGHEYPDWAKEDFIDEDSY